MKCPYITSKGDDVKFFKKKFTLQDIPLADYVVFCIKILLLFTVIVLILSTFQIIVPDTLISCFFAAFGGEFLVCGLIKIFKIRKKDAENVVEEGTVQAIGFVTDDINTTDDESYL